MLRSAFSSSRECELFTLTTCWQPVLHSISFPCTKFYALHFSFDSYSSLVHGENAQFLTLCASILKEQEWTECDLVLVVSHQPLYVKGILFQSALSPLTHVGPGITPWNGVERLICALGNKSKDHICSGPYLVQAAKTIQARKRRDHGDFGLCIKLVDLFSFICRAAWQIASSKGVRL